MSLKSIIGYLSIITVILIIASISAMMFYMFEGTDTLHSNVVITKEQGLIEQPYQVLIPSEVTHTISIVTSDTNATFTMEIKVRIYKRSDLKNISLNETTLPSVEPEFSWDMSIRYNNSEYSRTYDFTVDPEEYVFAVWYSMNDSIPQDLSLTSTFQFNARYLYSASAISGSIAGVLLMTIIILGIIAIATSDDGKKNSRLVNMQAKEYYKKTKEGPNTIQQDVEYSQETSTDTKTIPSEKIVETQKTGITTYSTLNEISSFWNRNVAPYLDEGIIFTFLIGVAFLVGTSISLVFNNAEVGGGTSIVGFILIAVSIGLLIKKQNLVRNVASYLEMQEKVLLGELAKKFDMSWKEALNIIFIINALNLLKVRIEENVKPKLSIVEVVDRGTLTQFGLESTTIAEPPSEMPLSENYCPNCGINLPTGTDFKFCPYCGGTLKSAK